MRRGFTLLELMVSIAITGIVTTAVVAAFAGVNSLLARAERQSELRSTAKALGDFFVTELQQVGGGAVRPHLAVFVENACGARGDFPTCTQQVAVKTDRLMYARTLPGLESCTVDTLTISSGLFDTATITAKMKVTAPAPCCLSPPNGDWVNKTVYLSKEDQFTQRFVSAVDLSTCTATLLPGQTTHNKAAGIADLLGGTVTRVAMVTVFVDPTSHALKAHVNTNQEAPNAIVFGTNEIATLANDVYDFQVVSGYDDGSDGILKRTGGADDEWLGNAATDAMGAGGLSSSTSIDLRALRLSFVVGATGMSAGNTVQIEGSVPLTIPKTLLHTATSNAMLRNTFLFQ
jgi:prepilin-type N-terminal cleavage/methylation domain-containing protein